MIDWTDGARQAFDHYALQARDRLRNAGADPEEVLTDLRQHLEQRAQERGLALLTASEVEQMLASMAEPEPSSAAQELEIPAQLRKPHKTGRLWLGGVVLPIIALGVQVATGICTVLFEPIPTFMHALLIASVPLASALGLRELAHGPTARFRHVSLAVGFALGIASIYALLFLPMMPISLFMTILGLGLLGLSPYFALFSLNALRKKLDAIAPAGTPRLTLRGAGIALIALFCVEASDFVTGLGLHLADSARPGNARVGMWLLRHLGSEPVMRTSAQRRSFEEGSKRASLLLFPARMFDPVSTDNARELYFRATGETVDGKSLLTRDDWRPMALGLSRRSFDEDLGGEVVGGALDDLSLASSRIDVHVKPEDSLAYLEWTQEFRNSGSQSRECRAQWRLPEGGVVSRVTLWVDGEPREAAFGSTGQVRRAYQQVAVKQRRDPLLVTWSGPNTVLVQAFPILPNVPLRIRIGVTVPLTLDEKRHGRLALPELVETNYALKPKLRHNIWVESSAALASNVARLGAGAKPGASALHGQLDDADLAKVELDTGAVDLGHARSVAVDLSAACPERDVCPWPTEARIEQRWQERKDAVARNLALVIDGSRSLASHAEEIAKLVRALHPSTRVRVWLASDEPLVLSKGDARGSQDLSALAAQIRDAQFIGGMENAPALMAALDWLETKESPALLWIHGPQGLAFDTDMGVEQLVERGRTRVSWTSLQLEKGPNRVLQRLAPLAHVVSLTGPSGLARASAALSGRTSWRLVRTMHASGEARPAGEATTGSDHVARLWASELVAKDDNFDDSAKRRLAAKRQLVTHLTGAVVLETKEQYTRNELEPVDPTSVPAIPEPGLLWLMALAALILLFYRVRERSTT